MKLAFSLVSLSFLILGLIPAVGQQSASAIAHLKDGRTFKGPVSNITNERIEFKLSQGTAGSVSFSHDEIDYVAFPPTRAWNEAMGHFNRRNYSAAATVLETVASQRTRANFYPTRGNFASLADRRLLDCYRRLMQPERIPLVRDRIEWEKLPDSDQGIEKVIDVWSAVGLKNWPEVIKASEIVLKNSTPGAAGSEELAYLRGLAFDEQDLYDDAVIAFGAVIGPFPGANRRTAADAIKRSAAILAKNAEREGELKALVHIYAKSFGNGKLWPEASAKMKELLAEKL